MTPRVSVLMAVRNGERHLDAAVESVRAQQVSDFEVIIVDDGSTDGTPQRLARHAADDARIRVVRQPPHGLAASLNRAAGLARGEYLARQDADDLSLPQRFARQVGYLQDHPSVAAVGSGTAVIDAQGRVVGQVTTRQGAARIRAGLLGVRASLVHSSVMMRRQAFEAMGGYREAFPVAQDYDLWLRMSERWELANVPEVLCRWRFAAGQDGGTSWARQLQYGAIAVAFARERQHGGRDSYALLEAAGGRVEAFAERYRWRGRLHALWGELALRGLKDPAAAAGHFRQAVANGCASPRTVCLLGWSLLGFGWPGRRPLQLEGRA